MPDNTRKQPAGKAAKKTTHKAAKKAAPPTGAEPEAFPTPYQKRMLWNAVTGISILILGALVAGVIWLGTEVIAYLQTVLIPLAVAGVIAYLLEPVVEILVKRGLSRFRAVLVVFLGLTAFLLAIAAYVLPDTIRQVATLIDNREQIVEAVKSNAEDYFAEHPDSFILDWISPQEDENGKPRPSKLMEWLRENTALLAETSINVLGRGVRGFGSALGIFLGVFLVPIYLWFFLLESQRIQENWEKVIPLKASKFKVEIVSVLREINDYLIAFFRGQFLVSLIDGALVGIGLMIFRLPYAPLLGIAVAILGLIPYIGNLLCWVPAVIIAFVHFSIPDNQHWLGGTVWLYPVVVSVIFFGVQQINSFITAPKIVGDSVGLHPMTVIFSVFFWSLLLGGALGALLAVPLTASVKVLFTRYVWDKRLNPEPS